MIYPLLIILPVLIIAIVFFSRSNKDKNKSSWVQFFARGKDAGFGFTEIDLLRKLAIKCNLEEPSSLFWSQAQLDRCIASYLKSTQLSGEDKKQHTQDFISKLYEYRKRIEFDKPQYKKGITDSRNIEEGQAIRILAESLGVYKSRLIKNTANYMTISRPTGPGLSVSFSWTGVKIAVYFWRKDDAGYVFDSVVQDEVYSKGLQALQISHSESMFRTQKRKSIRVKTQKPAYLYLSMGDNELNDEVETKPGLKCIVEDLSDTGCAITIGGKAAEGLRVKVQFSLNEFPIIMKGTVRSSEYNEEYKRSLLHIQADPLPAATQNRILGEVFGLEADKANLLSFNLLEDADDEEIPVLEGEDTDFSEENRSVFQNGALNDFDE